MSEEAVEQTTEEVSQPQEQTTEELEAPVDRVIPYSRFAEVNREKKELQRKLAEVEGSQKLSQYDPNDLEAVMGHPFVQEILIKQAKQELTDYARTTLESYPNLHPAVKKAILSNARGFVNETTTSVDQAKLDLQDFIDGLAEEADTATTPTPKAIKVATTNVSKTDVQGVRPAEIEKILDKPPLEWTDKDYEVVEEFKRTQK